MGSSAVQLFNFGVQYVGSLPKLHNRVPAFSFSSVTADNAFEEAEIAVKTARIGLESKDRLRSTYS